MPLKDIQKRLEERFSTPLSDFYDRRIIFWKDEDREFENVFDELELEDVQKAKLDGKNSFEIKKLLQEDDLTNNYLIYSPISCEKLEDNWLLNIELYSEEFRSDLTSLRMVEFGIEDTDRMRKTVKLYSKFFANKQREAKLKKLGNHYETPTQLHLNIMAVLSGAEKGAIGLILEKLFSDELEYQYNQVLQSIFEYGSAEVFGQMVSRFVGYREGGTPDLVEIASFMLVSALALNIDSASLRGLEGYISEAKKANDYSVVHEWMLSGDKKKYKELARHVEWKLGLRSRFEKLEVDSLLVSDVFPAIDEALLKHYFDEISENVIKVEEIQNSEASKRTQGWFKEFEGFYDCLYFAAKIQEFYLKYRDGFHFTKPAEIWKFYSQEAYLVDTWYRKFQTAYQKALQENNEYLEDSLRQAAEVIENRYDNWFLSNLMENWVNVAGEDFTELGYVSNIPRQKDFYSNQVSRKNKKGAKRVAVIVSDALRYEVAAELKDTLIAQTNGTAELTARQSVFPSITKFGMAGVLNWYKPSIVLNDQSPEVLLDGMHVRSTAEREKRLCTQDGKQILKAGAIQAEDFKEMKSKDRRAYMKDKDVIYIYHNKIDKVGHDGPREAFPACERSIDELRSLVKTLVNDNVTEIFVTADHGFLYTAEPLKEMNKVGRQVLSQEAYEYGRRHILAPEGTTAEYLLPVKMSSEYDGEGLIGFTPRDTSRIKIAGGKDNYVHGGISLQEIMVPVIQFNNKTRKNNKDFTEREYAKIQLLTENHKISNLNFFLDFYQPVPVGDKILPAVYQIYMEDEDGNIISDVKEVIADFDSQNNIDRKARVRFTLKQQPYDRHKNYKLVISRENDFPIEENFTIDIATADDFGFDF